MMPNGRNFCKLLIYLFGAAESLLPEWRYFQVQEIRYNGVWEEKYNQSKNIYYSTQSADSMLFRPL